MSKNYESLYLKLDYLGAGAHGIVNRCINSLLLSSNALEEYTQLSLEMRNENDKNQELIKRRMQLEQKYNINKIPNIYLALKRIRLKSYLEGLSMEAFREIRILQELKHDNILNICDVYSLHSNVNVVLELMSSDLDKVIRDNSIFLTPKVIKGYLEQLLSALKYIHAHFLIHRDLKPQNCLLDNNNVLKLADFGLARSYGEDRLMTPTVCTLWYRAPELLYGARNYGDKVDIWSAGCIFAELLLRKPLFPSPDLRELAQLHVIFQGLGTPDYDFSALPLYVPIPIVSEPQVWNLFNTYNRETVQVLRAMLEFDPSKRKTAAEILEMDYFKAN